MDSFEFTPAPARDSRTWGPKARHNRELCDQLTRGFFIDAIKRVREWLERQQELERRLASPELLLRREQIWGQWGKVEARYLRFLRTNEDLSHYTVVKTIGKGCYGEVKLVRKNQDGRVYALKRLIKSEVISKEQFPRVRAERDALAESDSEWVTKLYTTFQDSTSLYMLMEFCPGGDLMSLLTEHEIFSEEITRFYAAEIIMAIEAVHSLGFIHRDIKPDNILLDKGGHLKLADFGLSKSFRKNHDKRYYHELLQGVPQQLKQPADQEFFNIDDISLTVSKRSQIKEWRRARRFMAYSSVGTPNYMAPELFLDQGYSFEIDWWSLGAIVYECLVGWPPFASSDHPNTMRKIINFKHNLFFPDDIQLTDDAVSFVRSMITTAENRLGRRGATEIKNHHFFAGVDFNALRRIQPPFQPPLTSDVDTSCFHVDDLPQTEEAIMPGPASGSPDASTPEETFLPFIGYTFKRFDNQLI